MVPAEALLQIGKKIFAKETDSDTFKSLPTIDNSIENRIIPAMICIEKLFLEL